MPIPIFRQPFEYRSFTVLNYYAQATRDIFIYYSLMKWVTLICEPLNSFGALRPGSPLIPRECLIFLKTYMQQYLEKIQSKKMFIY